MGKGEVEDRVVLLRLPMFLIALNEMLLYVKNLDVSASLAIVLQIRAWCLCMCLLNVKCQ